MYSGGVAGVVIAFICVLVRQVFLQEERIELHGRPRVTEAGKKEARKTTIDKWQAQWTRLQDKAQWTKRLIPDLQGWIDCKHRRLNHHLTQAFSGHGCFRHFTYRLGKTEMNCDICRVDDTAEHVVFTCPKYDDLRQSLSECVNDGRQNPQKEITPETLIDRMLQSADKWNAATEAITSMIKRKEIEERAKAQSVPNAYANSEEDSLSSEENSQ
ncbi:uncharacterized protein [Euwallacea fornicatus]|uniref:uncharacterized protein n=1 Tax=Euwallacea fornicatus TaxID=995702 RepID=UPI00338DF8BE